MYIAIVAILLIKNNSYNNLQKASLIVDLLIQVSLIKIFANKIILINKIIIYNLFFISIDIFLEIMHNYFAL